jgi:DNA-binding CsgD family transcriptional regulator
MLIVQNVISTIKVPKIHGFLVVVLFCFVCTGCLNKDNQLVMNNGKIDLSNWDVESTSEIRIQGEGLFYWQQWPIDEYGNFNDSLLQSSSTFSWKSALWGTFGYNPKGFGTYRVMIKQKENGEPFAINIGRLLGATEVWINGKKQANFGKLSKDGENEEPYGQIINLKLPQEKELDILFLVSNHNNRLGGGFALQNMIQTETLNTTNQRINPLVEGIITFLIIIFGLFQIYWFIAFKKELYFLYFGLFCLIGVSRQLFVGETLIYNFFPDISFSIVQRMRYIGYFGGLALTMLYYDSLYPNYIRKEFIRIFYLIPLLGILYVLIVPIYYGTLIAPFFQMYGLTSTFIGVYIIYNALKDKKPYAKWVLLILIIQGVAFANDILTAMLIIQSKYIINYSIFCYIVFHVYLNHKFQLSKEKLVRELYSNINTLQSDINYKLNEIETLKRDTFQQIKSKERMVDNLKKVAASDDKVSIQSLIADLKSELLEDTQLVNIKNDIEGINKDFVQRIQQIHPNLTKTDLEICTYIRMSIERKEIARLRYTTVDAVKKARYRLRKKLELDLEDDLEAYLKSI